MHNRGTIIDMGANAHFSPDRDHFENYEELDKSETSTIRTADGHIFHALGKGDYTIYLLFTKDGIHASISITNGQSRL